MTPRSRAILGMMAVQFPSRLHDPVGYANATTSVHDWRIALCIAIGVPLEYIDPCGGYNLLPRNAPVQLALDGGAA